MGRLDLTKTWVKLDKKRCSDDSTVQCWFYLSRDYNLIPVLTAYENVEFAIRLINKHNERELREVMKILAAVGLEGLEDRKPNELSGAARSKRVAIARAW